MAQNLARRSIQIDMTNGPIFSKLLQFSIPLILSAVLQLLFNAADIVVVGRFAGKEALAAVGSTSSLINLIVNLFVGLSTGANVVAANFFGADNKEKISETVHTSILLSFISGAILTVFGVSLSRQFLVWMKSPDTVLDLSSLYLRYYFGGITATMVYNYGAALLRAKGDTMRPLFILFGSGFLNVMLNLLFVIVFKMSVAGVALATVLSQCLAAVLVVICLLMEEGEFQLQIKKLAIHKDVLLRIIKIGVPAGLQGIMFSFSNVIIQSAVNGFGEIEIAGNSAASSIEGFVWTSMNGFSQGTLTFVSQNLGASKMDRIKKVVIVAELTAGVTGLVLGNAVVLLGNQLLSLYSKDPEVIHAGLIRLRVICTTYLLCGIMDVMASAIRGIGHSLLPMLITMFGACISRILWIMTIFQIPRFHSSFVIFLSYPISWILTWVVLLACFVVLFKKLLANRKATVIQKAN